MGKPGGLPPLESLRSRNGVASLRKWSRFAPGWKILYIFDGNPIGDHNASPHGGGRRRRPPPCGEGRPKAAPHYVVFQYFQHRPPHIFLPLASACFIGNWPQLVSFFNGFVFVNIPGLAGADFLSV